MAISFAPASSPRQMPVKVTTAPTSVRPRASLAASLAASNGSRCRRTVAVIATTPPHPAERGPGQASSPGHRRKESDLARAHNRGIGADMGAVDRGADHFRVFEGVGIFGAAPAEPIHQIADRRDALRRLDLLFRLADAFADPGEVTQLQHAYSSIRWRTPARK